MNDPAYKGLVTRRVLIHRCVHHPSASLYSLEDGTLACFMCDRPMQVEGLAGHKGVPPTYTRHAP